MDLHDSFLKKSLDRLPRLKKAAKFALQGLLDVQDRQRASRYISWLQQHDPSEEDLVLQKKEAQLLVYRPLISIITPTYNTPEIFLHEMIDSVLQQTYQHWELILVDDASPDENVRSSIIEYAKEDERIKYLFLEKNHHIAGATNEAIKITSGEFVSLFDHDDILRPNALFEIAKALNANHDLDLIYTDEDKIIDIATNRQAPFFKPDWNPDFLRSVNYITHFTTIRKSLLDKLGYEDPQYNGAQDWELFLRITRSIPEQNIHHIPKILYSWRVHDNSTAKDFSAKPYVVNSQRKALESDLLARQCSDTKVVQDDRYPAQWRLVHEDTQLSPKVSVILTQKGSGQERRIRANTKYENYEIISLGQHASFDQILSRSTGEYIVIIDQKVTIQSPQWIEDMLRDAKRSDIGFVVAQYRDRKDAIEAMCWSYDRDVFDFIKTMNVSELTAHLYMTTRHNISHVPGGICMVKVSKVRAVASDASNSLYIEEVSRQLNSNGHRNLYNPYIKMVK